MKRSTYMNGLLFGGVSIAIFLLFYFIKPELNFNTGIGFITSLVIPIFFIRKGILEAREENEGTISFGEALAVAFPVYFIGSLLLILANVLVLNVDAEYKATGERESMETARYALEKTFSFVNVPEEDQQKAFEELEKNPPEITNTQFLLAFLISLIFPGLILCLIMSGVLKRT